MKHQMILMTLVLSMGLAFCGCSDEVSEARSMEQIYKENGVPVKISKTEARSFNKEFKYNAVLSGVEETSVFAMISDRIDKINVKVGDYVEKDQILIIFPTDNPTANYFQAKVAHKNSKNILQRYKALYESGGISKQDYDNVLTKYEVDKANWYAVKQTVKVKAPISGNVTEVAVRETEYAQRGKLLVTISNTSHLKARLNINENEIGLLRVGQCAVAEWNGNVVKGKVVQLDLAMNPDTKAFNAVVEFNNSKNEMRAGVSANVTVLSSGSDKSIIVERKNLVKEDGRYFLFIVENHKAVSKPVKIGFSNELEVEIVEGINPGDLIVVEGQMLLSDGSLVDIVGGGK